MTPEFVSSLSSPQPDATRPRASTASRSFTHREARRVAVVGHLILPPARVPGRAVGGTHRTIRSCPRGIGSRDGGREATGLVPRRGITVAGQCRVQTGFAYDSHAEYRCWPLGAHPGRPVPARWSCRRRDRTRPLAGHHRCGTVPGFKPASLTTSHAEYGCWPLGRVPAGGSLLRTRSARPGVAPSTGGQRWASARQPNGLGDRTRRTGPRSSDQAGSKELLDPGPRRPRP